MKNYLTVTDKSGSVFGFPTDVIVQHRDRPGTEELFEGDEKAIIHWAETHMDLTDFKGKYVILRLAETPSRVTSCELAFLLCGGDKGFSDG